MPFDPVIGGIVWAGVLLAFFGLAVRRARKNQPAVDPPEIESVPEREVRRRDFAGPIAAMVMPLLVLAGAGAMFLALSDSPIAHFVGAFLLTMLGGMLLLVARVVLKLRSLA